MEESAAISTEPRPIKKLDQTLINRIAAGEIIHRPVSALKELIENSIDARSTSIKVTVKDGGMKLLQIQDNGCGIRKADLPILAERFTTSKLSSFSDLSRIATYGFRGEALASISHVARLSVITKTKEENCAWKASYIDGEIISTKPGRVAQPEPCAGNDGTTIIIENLFYNTPTRLSALRSPSEEYARILDVLTKYAIHNPKISFLCKKSGSMAPELSAPPNSETSQAIRLLFGHSIAKELLHIDISSSEPVENDEDMEVDQEDEPQSWSAEAFFTNANYQAKKINFLLFINHRLVESPRMKRALEATYHSILPKGASPFIYLSLNIDPRNVDVNVHPTKREVHFLDEEGITDRICSALQKALAAQGSSRKFEYQTLLPGHLNANAQLSKVRDLKGKGKAVDAEGGESDGRGEGTTQNDEEGTSSPSAVTKIRTYSQHKVRTSQHDRTLDSMFPVSDPSQVGAKSQSKSGGPIGTNRTKDIKESQCFLTSVKNLRSSVLKAKHRQLTDILEKHTFVGIVDLERCLSLIQQSTNLYLVNHAALGEEVFYQLGLRQFGDFGRLKLEPPPSLTKMLEVAVNAEDTTSTTLTKSEIVEKIAKVLIKHREMLSEYFSFDISAEGLIDSIPLLLRDYIPNLDNLPSFVMRLGPQVDWTSETECFETFLRELAFFYSPLTSSDGVDPQSDDKVKAEKWQIQHVLFPTMRRYLIPPKSLLDGDVVQVASLPDLYKVFERC